MKINEAIDIINGTTSSVLAEESDDFLRIYQIDLKTYNYWFLSIPTNATNWEPIDVDWDCLCNINPQDLARVMDAVQRLLDTPVKDRLPEKKYRLRWMNDASGKKNYLCDSGFWLIGPGTASEFIFTESEIEQLKRDNPRFAPAIEAMKEEVKDDEEQN